MPEHDKNGRKIAGAGGAPERGVGKAVAWVFDTVYALHLLTGKPVPVAYLAERTGTDKKNLKRRHLKDLLGCGPLEETDSGVVVPEHARTRLRELLLATGAIQKDHRTRERVERQRRLHKVSILHRQGQDPETIAAETGPTVEQVAAVLQPADQAPTVKEMREWRATYNPNGEIGDLERHAPGWDTFVSPEEGQQPITSPDEGVVSLSKHRSSKKWGWHEHDREEGADQSQR